MSDKKENLFAKLAQQHAAKPADDQPKAVEAAPVEPVPAEPIPAGPPPSPALPAAKLKPATPRKKAEPVAGRRANPDYCQANAYVLKTVRRSVDRALLDLDGMDYSTLVEELLVKWLKSRRVSE